MFYVFLCCTVCLFLYGPFVMLPLNLTYLHYLQHSFFEFIYSINVFYFSKQFNSMSFVNKIHVIKHVSLEVKHRDVIQLNRCIRYGSVRVYVNAAQKHTHMSFLRFECFHWCIKHVCGDFDISEEKKTYMYQYINDPLNEPSLTTFNHSVRTTCSIHTMNRFYEPLSKWMHIHQYLI